MNNEWLLEYYYPIGGKVKFKKPIQIKTITNTIIHTDENTIGIIDGYFGMHPGYTPGIAIKIEQFNITTAVLINNVEII